MATVLVIENLQCLNENTCELLAFADHHAIPAYDGKEGIQLAKTGNVDVILCKILLPDINGFEILQMLRINPNTVHIPFVFFTVKTEPSEVQKGLKAGAAGYLKKPFTEADLLNTVDGALIPNIH